MISSLRDLPSHTPIFIDANIFLYFLLKDEQYFSACEEFLARMETGEIIGFTDTLTLNETIFLYLKTHLIARHNVSPRQFLSFAKSHPNEVAGVDLSLPLKLFTAETLRIVSPPHHIIIEYLPQLHRYGLLPNDTFHLLTMDYLNLTHIATNDKDFEAIPHISIWKP